MLNRVAIYSSGKGAKTNEVILKLIKDFCKRGIAIQLYEKAGEPSICPGGMLIEKFTELSSLTALPDLVLSIGGDGTFLETMINVKGLGIPVAGINTGRLGFLANISEDEVIKSMDLLFRGDYVIIERSLLHLTEPKSLFEDGDSVALNEITIQKADPSMITINVFVDETYLNTYWCDGLIISTATGSTAYNLSVGGPILSPEDESLIISPISPHNLTIRPIILTGDSKLRMVIEGRSDEYLVTCDFRSERVSVDNEIRLTRYPEKLKTIMIRGRDFYSTLRNKLMWGADKRNQDN